MPVGAEILIDRQDGTTAVFRVERVGRYPKDDLRTVEVYAATGRELRLITCGGEWDGDTASYRDNFVAYATLVDHTNSHPMTEDMVPPGKSRVVRWLSL